MAKTAAFVGACVLQAWLGPAPRAAASGAPKLLPFPETVQALETLSRGVTAVAVESGRLIIMPREGGYAITTPFHPDGKTREDVFGKLTDSQRLEVAKDAGPFNWTGIVAGTDRVLLLDGESLALFETDPKNLKEIVRRTLPWDMIAPPADRGGEPTKLETASFRTRFKHAFQATNGVKLSGIAPLPDGWRTSKKRQYLAISRIKGFPLLLLECDKAEASSCVVARQCYLEGASDLLADSLTGIAVSEARRLVYIGDRKNMRVAAFKFHSCIHVTRRSDIALPARLKTLTNLAIDADDRLFVTTEIPDDYHNASLFFWPKAAW